MLKYIFLVGKKWKRIDCKINRFYLLERQQFQLQSSSNFPRHQRSYDTGYTHLEYGIMGYQIYEKGIQNHIRFSQPSLGNLITHITIVVCASSSKESQKYQKELHYYFDCDQSRFQKSNAQNRSQNFFIGLIRRIINYVMTFRNVRQKIVSL